MKMSDLPVSVKHKTKVYKSNEDFGLDYKQPLSKKKLDAAENKHNEKVKKLMRDSWCIPVVFGGMVTI
jgi:hypothetical protein